MPRVAVVADESMLIRHQLAGVLEARGFSVESATEAAEVLNLLPTSAPDLLVLNAQLRGMRLEKLVEEVRSRSAKPPRLILLSSRKSPELDIAADSVIYKEAPIADQLETVLSALGFGRR